MALYLSHAPSVFAAAERTLALEGMDALFLVEEGS